MPIPQIMSRIWDGDPNERFTASDMRRVEDNANIIARYAGVPEVSFLPTDRANQFRYDEAQKIENQTKAVGRKLGVPVDTEDHWNYNRSVSYVDFERWESQQWKLYQKLGGQGDRIPSDKFLHTLRYILFSEDWKGTGPYFQDIETPGIRGGTEAAAYVAEDATPSARMDEFNGLLQLVPTGPQKARIWAYGIKPSSNIPIKITTKAWDMFRQITLRAGNWQGSGPWTQTVAIGSQVTNAVIGSDERNNADQIRQLADAVIGVSNINGQNVTVRAIGIRPTKDINATILYSDSAVV